MKKFSLQAKIGALMTLSILLISATGYLSFRSLSAIVTSIRVKSKPDSRLLAIREISNDLEKAENSVRMFTLTRNEKDIEPYYVTIAQVDDKINRLRTASSNDMILSIQIDTISNLIENNILIWSKMLDLYHSDSLDAHIRKLSAKLAVASLNEKNPERSILRRVFTKRTETKLDQEEIIRDLNKIEKQDSIQNSRLRATETQLAITGREIRERFYILISKMEDAVVNSINSNAEAAERLAMKTYRWLAMFALLGTLLVIMVLVIVVRFVRKTRDYQVALIKSKEETEKLATTRELFMADMSHEIRTPVNAIYGFTEQLLYKSFDEKSRKILDIIKSSADHLVKIVNDILDFSKLRNANIELEKTHFLVHTVFEEVQLLFVKRALENNTKLVYEVSKATPLVLVGDSYRLKQILINLVGNAVKFTANGEIHFSADCKINSHDTLDLILNVTDNGIGISDDMQQKVFDDFTQAEAGTSRKYGGTGLGLSIVKKLIELHQGTIKLESHKDKGTTIICTLPYQIGAIEQVVAPRQSLQIPVLIKSLNLLIVEDEEYNRHLFRTIFDRWNVRYDEAQDGQDAIDKIKAIHYDLVFMDIRMPGLDGIHATANIRDELNKNEIELPIIGISATHTTEKLKEYKQWGMNTFLPKPFTEKMLLDVILSVVKPTHESTVLQDVPEVQEANSDNSRVNLQNLYHVSGYDIPFVKQMLIQFIESTEQGLHDIGHAIITGNLKDALEIAHKISAPCRHIGADVLYDKLKTIEDKAQDQHNLSILAELSEASNKEFTAIRELLKAHILKINE